jgi:hypothetical protein
VFFFWYDGTRRKVMTIALYFRHTLLGYATAQGMNHPEFSGPNPDSVRHIIFHYMKMGHKGEGVLRYVLEHTQGNTHAEEVREING